MSPIQKLIEQDELIIACKKRAKLLYKQLKKSDSAIKLMHCQIKVAQEMDYKDWFDLYNSVKNKKILSLKSYSDDNRKFFEQLLRHYLEIEIQDILIEVRPKNSKIKLQYQGTFNNYTNNDFPYQYLNTLCHTIWKEFNTTNVNPDFSKCLSTRGEYFLKNIMGLEQKLSIRLQSVPAYPAGYDLILKIIPQHKNSDTFLANLGYALDHITSLKAITSLSVGGVIIAGTSRSEREATIKAILNDININNNFTVYNFDNLANDLNKDKDTNERIKLQRLYLGMRKEPNIITLELLDDEFSGKMSKKIIEYGYQLLSQINATSALDIIPKLMNLGLKSDILAEKYFLNGLCYQTFVPMICPHCSHSVDVIFQPNNNKLEHEIALCLKLFNNLEKQHPNIDISNIRLRNKNGCQHCRYMGINDRTVCAEIIEIDDKMRDLIRNNQLKELSKYWKEMSDKNIVSENMAGKTARDHALHKMLKGQIDPLHLKECFGDISN